jgi:hypothetical protein
MLMNEPEPEGAVGGRALPTWFATIDSLAQQMEMLERARPQGLYGIAVDRDPEALLWQKCHVQIQWLFKGLHWLTVLVAESSSSSQVARGEIVPVENPASEQEA